MPASLKRESLFDGDLFRETKALYLDNCLDRARAMSPLSDAVEKAKAYVAVAERGKQCPECSEWFSTHLRICRSGGGEPPVCKVSKEKEDLLPATDKDTGARPRDATAARRATEGAGAESACGPLTHLETIRHLQTAPTLGLRPWIRTQLKLRGCGVQKNEKVSKKELIKKLFKSLLTEIRKLAASRVASGMGGGVDFTAVGVFDQADGEVKHVWDTLESAFCHPLDVAPDADVDSDIGLDADTDLGFDDDDLDPVTAYSPENDGSCDEETSDEDSGEEEWVQGPLHGFRVGDKVRVWWSMQEPQGWFTGIIEKVGAEVLRVKYPDGWRDHDPNKWSIEKLQ